MAERIQSNKMGTQPVPRLMLQMAVPLMISMAIQALYNVVDSLFVSYIAGTMENPNLSDYALNALSLSFPVQMLIIALSVGTGVGVNATLSRCLGEGKREKASNVAGNALFMGVVIYLVFLLFGLFGTRAYYTWQTEDPLVTELGITYLSICTQYSLGAVGFHMFEKLLQSTGKTVHTMVAQLTGALMNIILDPILIFGYLGMPEMGVTGAALATVIGQTASLVIGAIFHFGINHEIITRARYFIPRCRIIADIYKVGLPAITIQALTPVMTFCLNFILGGISGAAVTAYGVYYKLQNFVYMPVFGLNNAIIPITAYNYGAGSASRMKLSIRWGITYAVLIMAVGGLVLQVFAYQIMGLFAISEELTKLCVTALRIITAGYVFAGVSLACQGILQALGHGLSSLIISATRMLIVVLPLAWLFALLSGSETVVWFAFPVAELCGTCIAVLQIRRLYRRKINVMEKVNQV
jgi:multidrug efflux pump